MGIVVFALFIILISIIFIKNFGAVVENPVEIRKIMTNYGIWAYLLYFLLYVFQIFFAPVPGTVLNIASGMLFGPLKGFLLSWAGAITGGFLAMVIVRYLGRKILYFFLEEKKVEFEKQITKRGLPLIIFLAIFPNPVGDGIFYLAGLTNIPLKILTGIIGLCRIPGILVYVIAGDKIMTSGIKGWIIGGGGFIIAMLFYFIFKQKLENLVERIVVKTQLNAVSTNRQTGHQ